MLTFWIMLKLFNIFQSKDYRTRKPPSSYEKYIKYFQTLRWNHTHYLIIFVLSSLFFKHSYPLLGYYKFIYTHIYKCTCTCTSSICGFVYFNCYCLPFVFEFLFEHPPPSPCTSFTSTVTHTFLFSFGFLLSFFA